MRGRSVTTVDIAPAFRGAVYSARVLLDQTSWSVFDGWTRPAPPLLGWRELDGLEAAAVEEWQPEVDRALALCARWRDRLALLGDGPSDQNWSEFRPLRLGREEDWSDWLAFLLKEGPAPLLREFLATEVPEKVSREVDVRGYRADLVLELPASRISIEVKLDDADIAKTFSCCSALEKARPGSWAHIILLPREREHEWWDLSRVRPATRGPHAQLRTWTELALAMRRCLWRADGTVAWRAWAVAYCGAVEQVILRFPCAKALKGARSLALFNRAARLSGHLTAGMEADDATR